MNIETIASAILADVSNTLIVTSDSDPLTQKILNATIRKQFDEKRQAYAEFLAGNKGTQDMLKYAREAVEVPLRLIGKLFGEESAECNITDDALRAGLDTARDEIVTLYARHGTFLE